MQRLKPTATRRGCQVAACVPVLVLVGLGLLAAVWWLLGMLLP